MPRSDRVLKAWYNLYNRKYFHNQLGNAIIQWSDRAYAKDIKDGFEANDLAHCSCNSTKNNKLRDVIIIHKKLRLFAAWNIIRVSILHEMAHIKTRCRDKHGKAFTDIMKKLVNQGAFDKHSRNGITLW